MEKYIEKLKQLDRIEYRIRESVISNDLGYGGIVGFLFLIISLIIIVTLPVNKIIVSEIIPLQVSFAVFALLFSFLMALATIISYIKESRKLNREYFDVVVKK